MTSLKTKIIVPTILGILIIGLVSGLIYSYFFSDIISKTEATLVFEKTNAVSKELDSAILMIESHVKDLGREMKNEFIYSELQNKTYVNSKLEVLGKYSKNLLRLLYETDKQVEGMYVVYNVEKSKAVHEIWYTIQNDSLVEQENEPYEAFYKENANLEWYYKTIGRKDGWWMPVYVDWMTNVPMYSYVYPVYSSNGENIGVVGVDVNLDRIVKEIRKQRIFDTGYFMLIDQNKETIVQPPLNTSNELIETNIDVENLTPYKTILKDKKYFTATILKNGQKLISVVPEGEVNKAFKKYQITIIIADTILILFLMITIHQILNKYIKKVKIVVESAERIEHRDFKTKIDVKEDDEIDKLSIVLNNIMATLSRNDEEHYQLEKAKTEFLSITSHELRSPMTPMKAQLQMMTEGYFGKLNKKQKEALKTIIRNTERLDKIIVDFLEISRIEAARLKFNFIKTNLFDYIKSLKEEMDFFLPEKKIEIVLGIDNLPTIFVDPNRTMQVLRNLINNAKKFSHPNSKIIVNAKVKGNFIFFSVKDFGVGIPKKSQLRIFEPFYQAEETMYRTYQGTGLGLAICKGIVESQNGRIWFDSIPDKGSTFYFTVPLEPVREIKAIKLLFSQGEETERQVKETMVEELGPIGESEFLKLKENNITKDNMLNYIKWLKKEGILKETEGFKNKIDLIFSYNTKDDRKTVRKKEVSNEDLSKFIKKRG